MISSALKYSNLHIILVAYGLMAGTYVLAGIQINIPLLITGCSGAFLVYQIDRCWLIGAEDKTNQPVRIAWIQSHRGYVIGSFIFFLGSGIIAISFLSFAAFLTGSTLAGLGVLYLFPIFSGGIRPKGIWYLKPLIISGAWSVGCVLFPVVQAETPVTSWILALVFYRFLFILPNVLLTDWQDISGDRAAGLLSIAMFLTERQLRFLSGLSAVLALVIGVWIGRWADWPIHFYVDLGGPCIMLILCAKPLSQSYLLYGLILDIVVAWPVITTICAQFV